MLPIIIHKWILIYFWKDILEMIKYLSFPHHRKSNFTILIDYKNNWIKSSSGGLRYENVAGFGAHHYQTTPKLDAGLKAK